MQEFLKMFSYPFIQRALIVGVLIAVVQRIREIQIGEDDEASKY